MLEKVVTVKENQQEIKTKKNKKANKFINNVPCNYRDAKTYIRENLKVKT